MALSFAMRGGAIALALGAAGAPLASACSSAPIAGVRVRISPEAAAVLHGTASSEPLVLHVRGVQAAGIVNVFVDDGSGRPFSADDDPRFVTYFSGEGGERAYAATAVVTAPAPLRKAVRGGKPLVLRFIGRRGDVPVESATLDAGR